MPNHIIEDLVLDDFIQELQDSRPYQQFRTYKEAEEFVFCIMMEAEHGTNIDILDHYSVSDFIGKNEEEVEYYDICGIPVYEDEQFEYDDHIYTAVCLMQTNGVIANPVFKGLESSEAMTCTSYEVYDCQIFSAAETIINMEASNV